MLCQEVGSSVVWEDLGVALAKPEARVAGAPRRGLVGRRQLVSVGETSFCMVVTEVSSRGGGRAVRFELGLAISLFLAPASTGGRSRLATTAMGLG